MRYVRELSPGQRSRITVVDAATRTSEVVYEDDSILFEAPNWSAEGLILNGDGRLWRLPLVKGAVPLPILISGVPDLNNDHVLAPDGATVFISANDWQIYAADLTGGVARRITSDDGGRMHFLHGVSPDGTSLAYIGVQPGSDGGWGPGLVFSVRIDGSEEKQLTTGPASSDGSEYSRDGEWIYFNTEIFSSVDGHAQIARMRADGSELEQLTFDDRVNWFPHFSTDGQTAVYLSFPPGTVGHPADLPVKLHLVSNGEWRTGTVVADLFGGQGTINVNSWSPHGPQFAYVDYPIG